MSAPTLLDGVYGFPDLRRIVVAMRHHVVGDEAGVRAILAEVVAARREREYHVATLVIGSELLRGAYPPGT